MAVGPLEPDDPQEIGDYRLIGRLGEGGQGVVYLAEGVDRSGHHVALKIAHHDPGTAFDFDEIAVIQRVGRFCTAKIIDAGIESEAGDRHGGRPYIVSEYVDGPSLQSAVESGGPLHGVELERLAVGTITALAATHAADVVHRDFKPHNVLLAADGPRVIDFGVATILGGLTGDTSASPGTPQYMAPEQIRGGEVGTAADVYAWAVTMTFAAIGGQAFGDVPQTGFTRYLRVEQFLVDLPAWLGTVVEPCLAEDPQRRPSARDLLLHLVGNEDALRGPAEAEGADPAERPPVPEPAASPSLPPTPTVGRSTSEQPPPVSPPPPARPAGPPPRTGEPPSGSGEPPSGSGEPPRRTAEPPTRPTPAGRRFRAATPAKALVLGMVLAIGAGLWLWSPLPGRGPEAAGSPPPAPRLTVGSANFTENILLSEIFAQVLEKAGFRVTRMRDIGSREVYYPMVRSGEVDVVPDYNGALASHLGALTADTREPMTTVEVDRRLREALPDSLRVLDSAEAENNDAIVVTRQTAEEYGLRSLADLKDVAGEFVLGGAPTFETRHQGVVGLREVYDVAFKDFQPIRPADHTMLAEQLVKGTFQAARLFTTDPAITMKGLVALTDPQHLFSAQNVIPLVQADLGAKATAALNAVSARLNTKDLLYMNAQIAADKTSVETMAKAWLVQTGLA